jgi:phosphoribosylglycinamide formyltransferase-1
LKKIAVFVSGSGTNLQSIIDAVLEGKLKVEISVVIASKPDIYAIERAKKANINVAVYNKKDYADLTTMYNDIVKYLKALGVEYIVLAGYLSILTPNIIEAYRNKIINIHPALLPKFGGKGYYGMRVHEAVINAKETESGPTVHFVDEGTDTGQIIAQMKVKVYPDDTPETLQKRVLTAEHILLPKTLADLLNDE